MKACLLASVRRLADVPIARIGAIGLPKTSIGVFLFSFIVKLFFICLFFTLPAGTCGALVAFIPQAAILACVAYAKQAGSGIGCYGEIEESSLSRLLKRGGLV